jgi:photosystem II stability/assembly factor-like uncharacterized protein
MWAPCAADARYAVAGHADQPDTFYSGSVGGGVWKTENSGRTWFPISDEGIPIGSIGAIAVAPSNPNIVYVGTGEPDIRSQNSYGIGMFKSTDAGKTWTHIGLEATRQIGRVVVDPTDPNRVYVAALGHIYDSNPERGVYRSTDGGATWKKVLFKTERPQQCGSHRCGHRSQESARALRIAVGHAPSAVVGLRADQPARRRPVQIHRRRRHLEAIDRRAAHRRLRRQDRHRGRAQQSQTSLGGGGRYSAALCHARGRRRRAPQQAAGKRQASRGRIYISDDAGATWKLVNAENRLWGRGWYFEAVTVDPTNPDRAYVMNTATYMTTDAGKTFVPVKGAPGGDDYHQLWVNPKDGNRMVLSSDQGTVVSVDGAKTWSTWYNQPTAQIYHVAADNRFPYWLYGAQQDSGGVGVSTWSREGVLTFRNWEPTCEAGESAPCCPTPRTATYPLRQRRRPLRSGAQYCRARWADNCPADPDDPNRKTWTLPQVFSQADEALYYANQFVFARATAAAPGKKSARPGAREPGCARHARPAHRQGHRPADDRPLRRGLFHRPFAARRCATVWVGTDDGLIYVTRDDGKNWNNVTPPAMTAWSKVSQIEAGHFDAGTAYASVDRHRLADNKPYIYRTHDGGKTWQNVVAGIPEGALRQLGEGRYPKPKGCFTPPPNCASTFPSTTASNGSRCRTTCRSLPCATSWCTATIWRLPPTAAVLGAGSDDAAAADRGGGRADRFLQRLPFKPGETYAVRAGSMNGTPLPHEEPQDAESALGRGGVLLAENAAK